MTKIWIIYGRKRDNPSHELFAYNKVLSVYELYWFERIKFSFKTFRQQTILNENHNQHIIDNLTNNEKNILYWASNGKTSEETSFILGLTKHTVQTYRKKAIQKLNASNISHSISIARSCNMIV